MIAESVRKLEPYVPGEQPRGEDVVKLNTNENPYPPSPKCAEALAGFDLDRLRKYPDPVFTDLRKALARLNKTVEERIFVGNGSDEILALAAKAFVEDDGSIGSLDPSYSLYKTIAAIRNVPWTGVERGCACGSAGRKGSRGAPAAEAGAGFAIPECSLFLWTNPNAPTGEFAEPEAIAAAAKRFKGVLLVDEAYADFARGNCMALAAARGNRNIIVMRTFSKSYSLAGLRVGYCVGPEPLIEALYKIKDSYNVDALAQTLALAAAKDQRWMKANAAKIRRTRKAFSKALESRGWDVIPSESNFVFARPPCAGSPARAAETVFRNLKERNIFVRYFNGPKTCDRLRITIGTDGDMARLLAALDDISACQAGQATNKANNKNR